MRASITRRRRPPCKLFARERIALLIDEGSFAEDGRYANVLADGLPADGVVTGTATHRRPARSALMANDSTVKAGSWGARTVEKIIRIIEKAYGTGRPDDLPGRLRPAPGSPTRSRCSPAGAAREDLPQPGPRVRRHPPGLRRCSGPSAAGGAYIPAFCDYVAMVDGNASMYLGSPRMVEMVVREKTTLEEMGGARMHCTVSGVRPLPG